MFAHTACYFAKKPYLCIVFFIVLDLRLTKVGVRRYPFFMPLSLADEMECVYLCFVIYVYLWKRSVFRS